MGIMLTQRFGGMTCGNLEDCVHKEIISNVVVPSLFSTCNWKRYETAIVATEDDQELGSLEVFPNSSYIRFVKVESD